MKLTHRPDWDHDFKRLQAEYVRMEPYHDIMKQLWEDLTEKYCPLTLIFYRKNKPKLRKVKKYATQMQNINSYASVCMRDFNELGTIKRILKHRGFSQLIAIVNTTPYEISNFGPDWRSTYRKWRTTYEMSVSLDITAQDADTLQLNYPSKAWGQLKMFA